MTEFSTNKKPLLVTIFILGAVVAYGYFTFIQQSDRRVVVNAQLDEIDSRLLQAEAIQVSCTTLSLSRENAPLGVRESCLLARDFVSWARGFSTDQKLKGVKKELLTLVRVIEEMNDAITIRPNSEFAKESLLEIPGLITRVKEEIKKVRGKFWL